MRTSEDLILDDANAMYLRDISGIKFIGKDEEEELFKTIKENPGTKKAERAREKLIVSYMPMVSKIAKKFRSKGLDLSDLIQEGNIGLMRAVDSFNNDKFNNLAPHAFTCINNAIINAIKAYDSGPITVDVDDALNIADDGLLDPEEAFISTAATASVKERVKDLLSKLNPRDVEILSMRFGIGGLRVHTQQEVADFFDISQQAVQQIEQRALGKMRGYSH